MRVVAEEELGQISINGDVDEQSMAAVLSRVQGSTFPIETILFQGCQIPHAAIQLFSKGLRVMLSVRTVAFWYCDIGDNKLAILARGLRGNKAITSLHFCSCGLTGQSATVLAELPQQMPGLTRLCLPHNPVGDAVVEAFAALSPKNFRLKELQLDDTEISDRGATLLAGMLSHSRTIHTLSLRVNNISREGVEAFARALEQNVVCTTLDLSFSRITDEEGRAALSRSMKYSPRAFVDQIEAAPRAGFYYRIDARGRFQGDEIATINDAAVGNCIIQFSREFEDASIMGKTNIVRKCLASREEDKVKTEMSDPLWRLAMPSLLSLAARFVGDSMEPRELIGVLINEVLYQLKPFRRIVEGAPEAFRDGTPIRFASKPFSKEELAEKKSSSYVLVPMGDSTGGFDFSGVYVSSDGVIRQPISGYVFSTRAVGFPTMLQLADYSHLVRLARVVNPISEPIGLDNLRWAIHLQDRVAVRVCLKSLNLSNREYFAMAGREGVAHYLGATGLPAILQLVAMNTTQIALKSAEIPSDWDLGRLPEGMQELIGQLKELVQAPEKYQAVLQTFMENYFVNFLQQSAEASMCNQDMNSEELEKAQEAFVQDVLLSVAEPDEFLQTLAILSNPQALSPRAADPGPSSSSSPH